MDLLIACLVDSNILLRSLRKNDPDYAVIREALSMLADAGTVLCYTLQNIAEFWNVATRPASHNGFGLSVDEAERQVREFEGGMLLVADTEAVYDEWRQLVTVHGVSGAKVHDARLVAAMKVHRITHLLTLNTADFARYGEITAIHPRDLAEHREI